MTRARTARVIAAAVVVAAIVAPFTLKPYGIYLLSLWAVTTIAAHGLNLTLGYAGQVSMAQGAFVGIGAYTVALLGTKAGLSFWLGLPAGIVLCAVAGYAIGSICLRSRGSYFAIFTLAVGIIIHLVIQKWESLTHGHIGVIGIPGPGALGPIHFDSTIARSYLALSCVCSGSTVRENVVL